MLPRPKQIKIFFIGRFNDSETLEGPEKVAKRLFEHISNRFEVFFFDYFSDGKTYSLFKKLFGIKQRQKQSGKAVYRAGIFSLLFEIIKLRPDIIHIVTYERFFFPLLFLDRILHYKIVYTAHGIAVYETSLQGRNESALYRLKDRLTEAAIYARADYLVFLSDQQLQFARQFYKVNNARVVLIPNGIDDIFEPEPGKIFGNGPLSLVFTGSVNRPEKGFSFLINCLQKVTKPLALHIISNEKFKNALTLPRNISFQYVDKMTTTEYAAFLRKCDAYFMASSYEPFSISTAEAMASGLVPIATHNAGIAGFITDGENGFLVEYNNTSQGAAILQKIAENKSAFNTIAQNAAKIKYTLSWRAIATRYETLYEEITGLHNEQ